VAVCLVSSGAAIASSTDSDPSYMADVLVDTETEVLIDPPDVRAADEFACVTEVGSSPVILTRSRGYIASPKATPPNIALNTTIDV